MSPDDLTQRGRHVLSRADVVIYDALADDRLLADVPARCLCLHVGKRGGQPSTPQAEIDRLLVAYCTQGKQIVRLKAGDPFIFGRSASELRALRAAGCTVEVVPGISSVLAAPLLAGIPLTDAALSPGFAAFSGHDLEALDWDALAKLPTLVFLMGGRNLASICDRLQACGKAAETPVAIVRWAGRPEQQVWTGTLSTIVDRTAGERLSPTVMVFGTVVSLREELGATAMTRQSDAATDSQSLKLAGQTILVTRSTGQASEFCDRLEADGAQTIATPALEIVAPSSWQLLDAAIARLREIDWLVLTSSNGVNYFFDRLLELGHDVRAIAHLKIAVVGKKTARALRDRGFHADYIPPDYIADALVEQFPESVAGRTLLFPRVETGGRDVLVRELSEAGATVIEAPAYESRCPVALAPAAADALRRGCVTAVTFASSKTVRYFARLLEQSGHLTLDGVAIASIGPQTTRACQQCFGRCDVEAEEFTLDGLHAALVAWAQGRGGV